MNAFGLVILAALVAELLLTGIADFLNLKHLRPDLPPAFAGVYDPRRYRTSQQYLVERTRFGWIVAAVNFCLLLILWFGGGFARLDRWVRGLDMEPVAAGVIYIGSLGLLTALVSLLFSLYATFVIEARYGFNRTTAKVFIEDRLKGLVLAVLLGTPLLASVLAFFQYAGPPAWLYGWATATLFLLLVQMVAPRWILPLFNRFTPLEAGPLRDAIVAYTRSVQFPLEQISVMDGSRRSQKSNAFFTGFGRRKRIVLFDTLIAGHSTAELVAVLAHEIGHYRKRHIWKMLGAGVLQAGLMFYLLSWVIGSKGLSDAFFMPEPSVYAGMVILAILYAPVDRVVGMALRALSRRHEFEADRFAAATTKDAPAMIGALKKLSMHNLSNLTPHPLYVFIHHSHPPVLKRIRALANGG
jgi:STE24 endopeptidase